MATTADSPFKFLGYSGIARAFPGEQVAHPEGQNEDKNYENLSENKNSQLKFEEKWGKWNSCPSGTVRLATPLLGYGGLWILATW